MIRFWKLTARELEIIQLVGEGKANKVIAAQLFISVQTVQKHLKNIYKKLEVHNKIEALNKFNKLASPPAETYLANRGNQNSQLTYTSTMVHH